MVQRRRVSPFDRVVGGCPLCGCTGREAISHSGTEDGLARCISYLAREVQRINGSNYDLNVAFDNHLAKERENDPGSSGR